MKKQPLSIRAFTMIDMMISVGIIGIMAVVAIPSFQEYAIKTKIAESYQMLSAMNKNQRAYFIENNSFITTQKNPYYITDSKAPWVDSNSWSMLGYTSGVDSYTYFSYQNIAGQTDSSGTQISDLSGDIEDGTFIYPERVGLTTYFADSADSTACSGFLTDTVVAADGVPNLHWVLLFASGNLVPLGENTEDCTEVLQILEYQEGAFSSTPIITIAEIRSIQDNDSDSGDSGDEKGDSGDSGAARGDSSSDSGDSGAARGDSSSDSGDSGAARG